MLSSNTSKSSVFQAEFFSCYRKELEGIVREDVVYGYAPTSKY